MRFSIIGLVCLALGGCISMNPGLGWGPPCQVTADGDLLLRGNTTEPMLTCVQKADLKTVKRVVADSNGGPVVVAVQIGELLAGLHTEMVVRGQCNSACANYFLPVARKITLEPGSLVMLHGSIDDALLSSSATSADADKVREQYDKQMAFVDKHRIPRGWLLMRDAEEQKAKRGSKYTLGQLAQPFTEGKVSVKGLLVEETFMRSCLPHIDIAPFNKTISQRIYTEEKLARALAKQGIFPSGTMTCAPEKVIISDPIKPALIPPITVEPLPEGQTH